MPALEILLFMDVIKSYITEAQTKSFHEKQKIALLGAALVTVLLFILWALLSWYSYSTTPLVPSPTPVVPSAPQDTPKEVTPVIESGTVPSDGALVQPSSQNQEYTTLEQVPAIYRPKLDPTL
ncbi:MAG: hypothetical protein RI911_556, partial [Candidatus Parcubacteria bacterium]